MSLRLDSIAATVLDDCIQQLNSLPWSKYPYSPRTNSRAQVRRRDAAGSFLLLRMGCSAHAPRIGGN